MVWLPKFFQHFRDVGDHET